MYLQITLRQWASNPSLNSQKPLILPLTAKNMLYPEVLHQPLSAALMGIQPGLWMPGLNPCFSIYLEDMRKSNCFFSSLLSLHFILLPCFNDILWERIWKVFRQYRPLFITLPLMGWSSLSCRVNCLLGSRRVQSLGNLLHTLWFNSYLKAVDTSVSRPVFFWTPDPYFQQPTWHCNLNILQAPVQTCSPSALPLWGPLWLGLSIGLDFVRRETSYLSIYGSACLSMTFQSGNF